MGVQNMYDYDENKYKSSDDLTNDFDFDDEAFDDLWAPYADETENVDE